MSQIAVDLTRCRKDGACVAVCPSGTLSLGKDGFPIELIENRCILCGHCVSVCGCKAITHSGLPQGAILPVARKLPTPAQMDGFLNSRRSVREFKPRPVPKVTIEALLDVARRAPTASNSQNLHWIVVSGCENVHALAQETINWIRSSAANPAQLARWDQGYDFVLRGAPTLVIACTPASYEWGKQDCAIALTFMELAAEARGLGVCWAGYLTRIAALHPPLHKALAVPEGYMIQGGLMLGERKYTYHRIPPRKPLSVQWN
jgi:nitroreductase/NAD-dependent dihydropyrimidine dehydrogenase PreA subunit